MSDASTLVALSGRAREQARAENFPVALRVLPAAPRARLLALYDFARFVDDVGDARYDIDGHIAGPVDRLRLLDAVGVELKQLTEGGHVAVSAIAGLQPLLADGVPVEPFHQLVEAGRRDQRISRYHSYAELVDYCRYSANPVGRVVLYLAKAATADRIGASDRVCTALQLLEHCQDVGEDARAGRIYLPQPDLLGVAPADLTAAECSPQLRRAVGLQVQRATELLGAGPPLVAGLHSWARIAVAGFVAGGMATADALRARQFEVLAAPVRPRRAGVARHAIRLWSRR